MKNYFYEDIINGKIKIETLKKGDLLLQKDEKIVATKSCNIEIEINIDIEVGICKGKDHSITKKEIHPIRKGEEISNWRVAYAALEKNKAKKVPYRRKIVWGVI